MHRHATLVGLLDEWSDRCRDLSLAMQHTQHTDIRASDGVRTQSPSRRAAADPSLRPHGHWYRQFQVIPENENIPDVVKC
jgi:hypothetical protein